MEISESPTLSSAIPRPYQPQGQSGLRSVAHSNSPAPSS
jgi:hypothetical protein